MIWKIKEDVLKVIFEIRPHDSCKEEIIALGFNTYHYYSYGGASLMAQSVKNPPAMQETWVLCLGGKDPLEEGMATTPVFLPANPHGFSPEETGGLESLGSQRVGHD